MKRARLKLSILLITYNQENYIGKCLEGIGIQQCDFDYNIVVADDASTDGTLAGIKSFSSGMDEKFVFMDSHKNIGYIKNYQRAFAACQGEYIAIIEGDDYWTDPHRLQKHVDFLDNHRECSFSFNRIIFFNEDKFDFSVRPWTKTEHYEYFTASQIAACNHIGNLSACVFRKNLIDTLPEEVYEFNTLTDWFLGVYMGQFGLVAELKRAMSVYRIHGSGVWAGQNAKKQLEQIRQNIPVYNRFFDFKFDKEYKKRDGELRDIIENRKKRRPKDFLPPFILSVAKWLIPPVFYQ